MFVGKEAYLGGVSLTLIYLFYTFSYQAREFVPGKLIQSSPIFVGKPRAYSRVENLKGASSFG
jgi:hypothetical protein